MPLLMWTATTVPNTAEQVALPDLRRHPCVYAPRRGAYGEWRKKTGRGRGGGAGARPIVTLRRGPKRSTWHVLQVQGRCGSRGGHAPTRAYPGALAAVQPADTLHRNTPITHPPTHPSWMTWMCCTLHSICRAHSATRGGRTCATGAARKRGGGQHVARCSPPSAGGVRKCGTSHLQDKKHAPRLGRTHTGKHANCAGAAQGTCLVVGDAWGVQHEPGCTAMHRHHPFQALQQARMTWCPAPSSAQLHTVGWWGAKRPTLVEGMGVRPASFISSTSGG